MRISCSRNEPSAPAVGASLFVNFGLGVSLPFRSRFTRVSLACRRRVSQKQQKTLIRTNAPLVRSAARHANPLLTAPAFKKGWNASWKRGREVGRPASPPGRPRSGLRPFGAARTTLPASSGSRTAVRRADSSGSLPRPSRGEALPDGSLPGEHDEAPCLAGVAISRSRRARPNLSSVFSRPEVHVHGRCHAPRNP